MEVASSLVISLETYVCMFRVVYDNHELCGSYQCYSILPVVYDVRYCIVAVVSTWLQNYITNYNGRGKGGPVEVKNTHLYESLRNSDLGGNVVDGRGGKELRASRKLDVIRDIQKGSGPAQYIYGPRLLRFLSGNYNSRPCPRYCSSACKPNLIASRP